MATNKKKIFVTQTLSRGARALLTQRDDIELVEFPNLISAKDFEALLKSHAPVHGVALGATAFGETELEASKDMKVVTRIGVGYDAVDVPALSRRKVPLMVAGSANSPSVAEAALFMMLTLAKRAALPGADFVTIHCPKTPETVGLFDAARIGRMKPKAYLINTARGGIVKESALYDALTSGRLAGAGIDVFEVEPPPVGNALFALPNVIIAPHVAGVTVEAVERMSEQTARNILSVLDGDPIRQNVINQDVLG